MTRKTAGLALTLLLESCSAGWRTISDVPPAGFPDDAVVEIGTTRGIKQLQHVHVETDTLRGVYESRPYSCVRCRVAVARDQITSIRVLNQNSGGQESFFTGFALGFIGFWAYVLVQ